jgi:hypothetical protein
VKKLLVYLDDDFHEDIKELAHRKKTSMGALVRYALDYTFEDDLDDISGTRALEELLADPSQAISLDEYMKRRGIELRGNSAPKGRARSREAAKSGR